MLIEIGTIVKWAHYPKLMLREDCEYGIVISRVGEQVAIYWFGSQREGYYDVGAVMGRFIFEL